MNAATLAVVMCVYRRPERLAKTLTMLKAQTDGNFDVLLVVNNPELVDFVAATVEAGGQPAGIHYNATNRGSFAKLEAGHRLAGDGYPWIVLLDDDFDFPPTLLAQLRAQARSDALVSWRVHTLIPGGNYWHRTPTQPGCVGSYVEGTGTIVPAGALLDSGILDDYGRQHSAADNVWLSYYANHVLGYQCVQGDIRGCTEVQDGKNQYRQHIDMKVHFLDELRRRGWRV